MILTIFGTTGELIKLYPVLDALQRRGRAPLLVTTGQQAAQIPALLSDFGLPQPALWLGRGHRGADLERVQNLPVWVTTVLRRAVRHRTQLAEALRDDGRAPLVLVHGDTMTTVLGAAIGRALGSSVAHLEAGLRSGSWHNPFPEELDRRAASALASIHLAPGAWAVDNLRRAGVHGEVVDTGANTIRDSLELVAVRAPDSEASPEPFGLVSLHRQELLGRPRQLKVILELLREKATEIPLRFINHPITAAAIADARLEHLLGDGIEAVPRQGYRGFVGLVKRSAFLVTDSGGSQEECAALGIPCLVHRATTERLDGLADGSVVLSRMDPVVVRRFLREPERWRREPGSPVDSPTDVILGFLESRGFV